MERLPIEIWIKICGYLKSSDLISFCNAFSKYKYLLLDRSIVKNFDLNGNFSFCTFNLGKYIIKNVNFINITSLNVNKLYWISLNDLRVLIRKLSNLECLLALDTNLSLRSKDISLYGRLKTLAITIDTRHISNDLSLVKNNMYLLKRFCLKIVAKRSSLGPLYRIFKELFGLQELWIEDADEDSEEILYFDPIVFKLQFLEKLVIKGLLNMPYLDYKLLKLAKVFDSRRFNSAMMIYVKLPREQIVSMKNISMFGPYESELEAAYEHIKRSNCEMPYGYKCAEKIYLTRQIKDVQFEELNFYVNICCNPKYMQSSLDFLKSDNAKSLQKLCIKSCILQQMPMRKARSFEKICPFLQVVHNCKVIKLLEIVDCEYCNVTSVDGYFLLCNFINLESFSVEVPLTVNGRFLKDVIKHSKKLKVLKVWSRHTNEPLSHNLYSALEEADSLEDFCYQTIYINLSKLLDSLTYIHTNKLKRVCICCKYYTLNICSLKLFLEKHKQLVFFYFGATVKRNTSLNQMQQLLNNYKGNDPAKIYFAKQNYEEFIGRSPVPDIHRELFRCRTNVSVVDLYNFE